MSIKSPSFSIPNVPDLIIFCIKMLVLCNNYSDLLDLAQYFFKWENIFHYIIIECRQIWQLNYISI